MDSSLSVFCLVDGEAPARAFRISISSTATVSDLKKLIKTEKPNEFSDVDADMLTLWRIFISPTNVDDDEVPVSLDTLTEKIKLRPISRLSKVFTEQPSEEAIHIIVQRPPPGKLANENLWLLTRQLMLLLLPSEHYNSAHYSAFW